MKKVKNKYYDMSQILKFNNVYKFRIIERSNRLDKENKNNNKSNQLDKGDKNGR